MQKKILKQFDPWQACKASDHIPNAITQREIKAAREGKGLIRANSVEELFKKMGL